MFAVFSWWKVALFVLTLVAGLYTAETRPYIACFYMFIAGMALYEVKMGVGWHLFKGLWFTDEHQAIAFLRRQIGPRPGQKSTVILVRCVCDADCPKDQPSE